VRYNPSTTTAKLSCELYPTPAQNKRYLGDLLEKLTNEAKDAKDTFEDVPFDFRHHKPKPKHLFPEHWKLTEERRESLEARRQSVLKKEFEKMENGEVVEGAKLIEELLVQKAALPKQSAKGEKERELLGVGVLAGGDQKGKGQKGRIARQR
jgi:small subunit ribosomal protein S35